MAEHLGARNPRRAPGRIHDRGHGNQQSRHRNPADIRCLDRDRQVLNQILAEKLAPAERLQHVHQRGQNARADPTEQHDLSAERPEKLAELEAALAAHNAEQAPPAWPREISMPVNIDKDLSQPDAPDDEYIYWSN